MKQVPTPNAWEVLRGSVSLLDLPLRQELAAQWARDAQFEHASIASFGRFALELLAVGAPAELVERAHRAAIDEIEHARLCFSLASLYGGVALGPGPLPIDASAFSSAPDLVAMTHATVLEGCVNETLAALEAEAGATHAEPEAVREVLRAIQRQETDHASLAFAFVSWALAVGGAGVRAAAVAAFQLAEREIKGRLQQPEPEHAALLRAHGRLSAAQRTELRERAVRQVVTPAATELLRL